MKRPSISGKDLWQFVKFGLVGVSNTLISYATEMVGYYLLFAHAQFSGMVQLLAALGITATGEQVRVVVVTLLGFLLSVSNAYFWNSRYVFKTGEKRSTGQHIRAFLRTAACYALTGLVLSPAMKIWLGSLSVPFYLASPATLIITIPLNFLLNKFWAFSAKQ